MVTALGLRAVGGFIRCFIVWTNGRFIERFILRGVFGMFYWAFYWVFYLWGRRGGGVDGGLVGHGEERVRVRGVLSRVLSETRT